MYPSIQTTKKKKKEKKKTKKKRGSALLAQTQILLNSNQTKTPVDLPSSSSLT